MIKLSIKKLISDDHAKNTNSGIELQCWICNNEPDALSYL